MENPELVVNYGSIQNDESVYTSNHCTSVDQDLLAEKNMRQRLAFFFMNPCEKFRARGRKPWKLSLQIIKIAVVTMQLVVFGLSNQMVETFENENTLAFKHLFLKGYVDNQDDSYAVYRQADFYDHISFTINEFLQLRNISLGTHAYDNNDEEDTPLSVCQEMYKQGSVFPENGTFDIDPETVTECIYIEPPIQMENGKLEEIKLNLTVDFYRLLILEIMFKLKAINLQTILHQELPDCYDFTLRITFDNKVHSGKIKITLDNDIGIRQCKEWHISGTMQKNTHYIMIFDTFVILVCLSSLTLCIRSVVKGICLQRDFASFFEHHYKRRLSWTDRMQFVNGWYILIIVSDVLTIIGSILKMEIQIKNLSSYDICSIYLGTSTLFVWLGVIRYLKFFKKYNLLILTLQSALPSVMRFLCCAGMIYLGYCFCGWIVLGPHHAKFRSLNTVSECLFSLINGDDMFATFAQMRQKSYVVWLFSRIYLYTFISLFIYMVLSLFIALITDTYDTIKHHQEHGFPETDLRKFISQCKDLRNAEAYTMKEEGPEIVFCCCKQ